MKFKKPKFWDYQRPNLLSYILLPLTFPLILNNFLLNKKKNKKKNHTPKKICVGNIYVGGTAKTPLTIKIYQILNKEKNDLLLLGIIVAFEHTESLVLFLNFHALKLFSRG